VYQVWLKSPQAFQSYAGTYTHTHTHTYTYIYTSIFIYVEDIRVMWTGLVWLRIGTGGELLWIPYWSFGLHKMLVNYRVSKQLGISRVVLSSMELLSYTCRLPWPAGRVCPERTAERAASAICRSQYPTSNRFYEIRHKKIVRFELHESKRLMSFMTQWIPSWCPVSKCKGRRTRSTSCDNLSFSSRVFYLYV
jgi:hypothetical protein